MQKFDQSSISSRLLPNIKYGEFFFPVRLCHRVLPLLQQRGWINFWQEMFGEHVEDILPQILVVPISNKLYHVCISTTRMLHIKSVWSIQTFGVHPKDFLTISENFENFHIELPSQPMLS